MKRLRTLLPAILGGSAAILVQTAQAANYTWGGSTTAWSLAGAWTPSGVPPTTNVATDLFFGGDASVATYTSTNDLGTAASPFTVNQIFLQGTDSPVPTGSPHLITGNLIKFAGADAEIRQTGAANFNFNTPINFNGSLLFSGNGLDGAGNPSTVTLNAGLSGVGDITKSGFTTFRFGTIPVGLPAETPSANTWMGTLIIDDGTVRFNNNAQAASSALRANPVYFSGNGIGVLNARRDSSDENSGFSTSLRMGTLSGFTGRVEGVLSGSSTSNFDIVITALQDGSFGGSISLPTKTGGGNDGGDFVVRGPGNQTLTGDVRVWKDSVVGYRSTLTLSGGASLSNPDNPSGGSMVLSGGSLVLDNSFGSGDRLRDGSATSTTIDTIGGGTLRLIGASTGTTELTGRLQLGSPSNPRSGALKIVVEPTVNTTDGLTQLTFQSYSRNQASVPLSTVEFSGQFNGSLIALGSSPSAKIFLHSAAFTVPVYPAAPATTGLLTSTDVPGSVGWATVNTAGGLQFATYGANGVVAAAVSIWNSSTQAATANAQLGTNGSTPGTGVNYPINSIRLVGAAAPPTLSLGPDTLSTTAILLANAGNFIIDSTTGSIGGTGPRFFTVAQGGTLQLNAPLTGSANPIVKSGDGTLVLNRSHAAYDQVVAVNQGALRAVPGDTLPRGELRLRGGQLEIQGGGTFARNISFGPNTVNWTGVDDGAHPEIDNDRGSGGFSAAGADASIVLNGSANSLIAWEDVGFLASGYALTFGSLSAQNRVTWTNNLSLSAAPLSVVNYNAREIYVYNNPATTGDTARISGTVSGRVTNDLLKTGPGDLELTANNTYLGATIVQNGRLFVNGNSQSSFLHKVMTGATLAGKGTVGSVLVDAGGKIMPGMQDSMASILNTKDLQFTDATSKLAIEIGGATPGGDSLTGYDQIRALDPTGNATIRLNGATLEGTFLNGYLAGLSDIFFLILNDGTDAVQGKFAQGNLVTIGTQSFNISYTANSDTSSFTGGNDVALQLVPEPSSVLLLGLGTLLVARRRRQVA